MQMEMKGKGRTSRRERGEERKREKFGDGTLVVGRYVSK